MRGLGFVNGVEGDLIQHAGPANGRRVAIRGVSERAASSVMQVSRRLGMSGCCVGMHTVHSWPRGTVGLFLFPFLFCFYFQFLFCI